MQCVDVTELRREACEFADNKHFRMFNLVRASES